MSEAKQTAVDWLYDRFLFAGYATPSEWKDQAKAMEKEQIKDAFDAGTYVGTYAVDKDGEEYYYETYEQ